MKHILFLLLFIPLFSYAQPHTVITCENNKLILKREGSIVELTCYTYRVSANTIVIKDEYTYRITSQQVQRPIREVQSLIENCGCYTTSLGPAGADGLSAYQLAVEQGYPDSLEAWLASLNGDGFYWQGDWSDANEYESGVVVRGSDDNLYVCYDNHTSSSTTEPITGVSWATKWDLFLTKGEDGVIGSNGADGNDGLGFNYRQAFFLGDTIRVNDIVVGTNGNLYICYNEHESSNDSYPVTGVDHTLYYNLFLPKGAAGANGMNGTNGQGVPVGGTTNQVLSKIDGTDYNTTWSNPVAGANADMTRTSTSGETINFVAKSFAYTSSSNLGWGVGTRIRAFASVGNYIEGPITTVSATAVTFTPDVAVGSGTHFSWTLSIAGIKGDAGSNGSAGTTYVMETTSTTSNSISVASKTFNYSATSLGWAIGTRIRAYNDASNYMSGVITAVSGISVTLDISYIVGSGTYTAWTLSVTGDRGDAGATGEYTASIISSPSGTVTLARRNETFCETTLTNSHTFTIALETPTSGFINEYVFSFKTGATLPAITQPASIKWRVAAPTLAINENWTIVYQNIEVSAGVYEIWASAVKAI